MRNNVVIMGLKEEETEDYSATENIVKDFMKKDLKMTEDQVTEASIERAHRLGRVKDSHKPRAIVVRFLNSKSKDEIMGRGFKLKDTQYLMFQQFPREIVERRRILIPIMKESKAQKMKVRLTMDKLYINDQHFRDQRLRRGCEFKKCLFLCAKNDTW